MFSSLLLIACSSRSVAFKLDINADDAAKRSELVFASMRVIERRLKRIGERITEHDIRSENGMPVIDLTLSDPIAVELLTEEMEQPFTMRIMHETEDGDGSADAIVAGHGGFRETGVTERHILWAEAQEDDDPARGRIVLMFTEEGRKIMRDVFTEHMGTYLGLFLRGKLMSKMLVESNVLRDDIVIRDIPSPEISSVFADDVNVGLYVTFIPIN